MRRTGRGSTAVMILALGSSALARPAGSPGGIAAELPRTTATFTPTALDMPNPERGFYRAGGMSLDELTPSSLAEVYADGYRLIYLRVNLEAYRTTPIAGSYLRRLDAALARVRDAGVKVILRPVYNYPKGETGYQTAQDAALPVVLGHLDQLAPVLRRHAGVIAFVQAGLVGAWGEWHTSSNGLTEPAARTRIKDALLRTVPTDRFVQFRYPPHVGDWVGAVPTPAAAIARGFRIGLHNDCFLASRTDVGTYSDDEATARRERAFADRMGDVAPFGGETCNPADDPGAVPRTGCADILGEGARYNLTYLDADYYRPLFMTRWKRQGCFGDVSRRMGYRFALRRIVHAPGVAAGGRFAFAATVRNDGWARLFNPRPFQLVLRSRTAGTTVRIDVPGADPRRWLPGGDAEIAADVVLPAALVPGEYDVLVALPDDDPRLREDPRYAIRFANADAPAKRQSWVAALGAFDSGTILSVTPASRR